jgi:hypothetical protein
MKVMAAVIRSQDWMFALIRTCFFILTPLTMFEKKSTRTGNAWIRQETSKYKELCMSYLEVL